MTPNNEYQNKTRNAPPTLLISPYTAESTAVINGENITGQKAGVQKHNKGMLISNSDLMLQSRPIKRHKDRNKRLSKNGLEYYQVRPNDSS